MAIRARFEIEQIDNGYLVDAIETQTDPEGTPYFQQARFFVSNALQLLDVLASGLIVDPAAAEQDIADEVPLETNGLVEWPTDEGNADPSNLN